MADLNVIGDFNWDPPLKNISAEVQLIAGKRWEPSSDDFAAVAGKSVVCPTFKQFLGVILNQRLKSIGRINVFTHSNADLIAFGGRLIPRTTMVDVMLNIGGANDLTALGRQTLDTLNIQGQWFQINQNPKRYFLRDIRQRFTDNAIIFFYSCHSGLDPGFLQAVSDTFQVMVDGFKPPIVYCPRYTTAPPSIDRKHIGLRACDFFQTTNFYELAPFAAYRNLITSKKPRRP